MSASPVDQKLYGQIVEVPLDELHTFKNHPSRVVDDESMEEMVESIRNMESLFLVLRDQEQRAGTN